MRSLETHNNWDWNSTTAPWLHNVGLERLQETNIFHILRATRMCQCADPRDRVFGILSLLSNDSSDYGLRADYSLSFREMVIGLFSHAILKLRDLGVVRFAAGLHNYSKFPSWMPDLELLAYDVSSEDGLKLSNCQSIVVDDEVRHGGTPWYLGTTIDSSTGALFINLIHLLEFQSSPRKTENVESMKDWHRFIIPGHHASFVLSSNLPLDELVIPTRDHLFCLNDGKGSPIFLVMSLETDNHTYKLMGICRHVGFQDQRMYLRESIQEWNAPETSYTLTLFSDWAGYNAKNRSNDQNLHLRSLQYNLHTQLEAINSDDTSLDVWADDPSGIKSFKQKLGFGHGSDCTLKPILMSLINKHNKDEPGFFAYFNHCIPESLRPQVEVYGLDEYIVVTVTEAPAKVDSRWWHNPDIKWRFAGQTCIESSPKKDCSCRESFDNTPITRYRARINWGLEDEFPPVGLLSEYASREEDGRGSRNVSGHCMLWQKYSAYDNALSFMMGANRQNIWSPSKERILWPAGLAVQIRIPVEAIKRRIKQTMAWKTLHRLNRVSPISSEDDLNAILGSPNPNPDFRSIAVPGWPTELVDDFNIDGSVQQVCIL